LEGSSQALAEALDALPLGGVGDEACGANKSRDEVIESVEGRGPDGGPLEAEGGGGVDHESAPKGRGKLLPVGGLGILGVPPGQGGAVEVVRDGVDDLLLGDVGQPGVLGRTGDPGLGGVGVAGVSAGGARCVDAAVAGRLLPWCRGVGGGVKTGRKESLLTKCNGGVSVEN